MTVATTFPSSLEEAAQLIEIVRLWELEANRHLLPCQKEIPNRGYAVFIDFERGIGGFLSTVGGEQNEFRRSVESRGYLAGSGFSPAHLEGEEILLHKSHAMGAIDAEIFERCRELKFNFKTARQVVPEVQNVWERYQQELQDRQANEERKVADLEIRPEVVEELEPERQIEGSLLEHSMLR